ncbi:MAG: phosphodiesterase [Oscillospiraceae bacterium]|nr:phosphodiesterase [Oscillospiraceae bacterium]
MKYIIASDIHGSALYCGKLLERYKAECAEGILLLGDVLYHGPRNDLPEGYAPKEVIAMLNPLKSDILCVRGNCEAEVDQMVLDFDVTTQHRSLSLFNHEILMTHGHHINIDAPPTEFNPEFVLYGHTHVPLKAQKDGVWYLNPGSVTIPKNGSAHSYMTLDEGGFTWKTIDGEEYDRLEF